MRIRSTGLVLLVVVGSVFGLGDPASAADSAGPSSRADAIAAAVRAVTPGTIALAPGVQNVDALRIDRTQSGVVAPKDDTGTVRVPTSANGEATVGIGLPGRSGRRAEVASDGTVTYQGSLVGVDVAVQPLVDSVRIDVLIKDAMAPTSYRFPLTLTKGSTARLQKNGGVLLTDASGNLEGEVLPPFAKDARGTDIPTHFRIDGNVLVQVVDHTTAANVAYPIVADPWLGRDLIQSASWTYHSGYGWTLKVVPTDWQRFWNGYLPAEAGWDELYSKYQHRGLDTNLGSMRNQYLCHVLIVSWYSPGKSTWDLDEWRPDVGLTETINHKCNPGPGGFPGEW